MASQLKQALAWVQTEVERAAAEGQCALLRDFFGDRSLETVTAGFGADALHAALAAATAIARNLDADTAPLRGIQCCVEVLLGIPEVGDDLEFREVVDTQSPDIVGMCGAVRPGLFDGPEVLPFVVRGYPVAVVEAVLRARGGVVGPDGGAAMRAAMGPDGGPTMVRVLQAARAPVADHHHALQWALAAKYHDILGTWLADPGFVPDPRRANDLLRLASWDPVGLDTLYRWFHAHGVLGPVLRHRVAKNEVRERWASLADPATMDMHRACMVLPKPKDGDGVDDGEPPAYTFTDLPLPAFGDALKPYMVPVKKLPRHTRHQKIREAVVRATAACSGPWFQTEDQGLLDVWVSDAGETPVPVAAVGPMSTPDFVAAFGPLVAAMAHVLDAGLRARDTPLPVVLVWDRFMYASPFAFEAPEPGRTAASQHIVVATLLAFVGTEVVETNADVRAMVDACASLGPALTLDKVRAEFAALVGRAGTVGAVRGPDTDTDPEPYVLRSSHGGLRYLGSGGFGCVLDGAILDGRPPTAVKVLKADSSVGEEVRGARLTQALDPTGAFTMRTNPRPVLVAVDGATVDTRSGRKVPISDACNGLPGKDPRWAFTIDAGGLSMDKYVIAVPSAFVAALEPLFVGLVAMAAAGVPHHDIKRLNIVSSPGGFKYIDFGLAGMARFLKRDGSGVGESVPAPMYPVWAPEYWPFLCTWYGVGIDLEDLAAHLERFHAELGNLAGMGRVNAFLRYVQLEPMPARPEFVDSVLGDHGFWETCTAREAAAAGDVWGLGFAILLTLADQPHHYIYAADLAEVQAVARLVKTMTDPRASFRPSAAQCLDAWRACRAKFGA